MHILFVEEDAQDYLKTRQLLDEKASKFNMDWAPNYEVALKQIQSNHYDVFLLGYNATRIPQQNFLTWLYESVATPTILLTKHDEQVDSVLGDKYLTYSLDKEQFNWQTLERAICYLSNLIALQKKANKFKTVFNRAFEFMALLKADGILQEINQTGLTLFGSAKKAVIGNALWDMPWATHIQNQLKAAVEKAAGGEIARYQGKLQKANGQSAILDFSFTPLTNVEEKIIWILLEGCDVSDCQALEQQLAYCNLHDQLTELPNRHLFMEELEKAINRAKQNDNYYIAVLFVGLDKFRMINASLGHDMGDWLLMKMTQRLQTCLDKKNLLARTGGGFVILLDDIQDFTQATRLATTISEVLDRPFSLAGYEIVMSCNIGIAYHTDQEGATELLRDADTAMYRAKMKGNAYAVFRQNMYDGIVSRLQMETDLLHATTDENFVLFYRPQIKLASEQLVAMESLIRFRQPRSGEILPVDFIPVLEETGIIISVGEWILQTACRQLKAWWEVGLLINRVTVNLSAHQFRHKNLIKTVIDSIENVGLEPESLELEITENLLSEEDDSTIQTLKHFKDMGIRITIDDFGMGYASLNHLRRFPADCLKINNLFIKEMISSPESTAITVATIDMAHALGLTVIAKGVENTEQRDFLRDQGCDFAQGSLYAAPMENTESLEWIKQHHKMIND